MPELEDAPCRFGSGTGAEDRSVAADPVAQREALQELLHALRALEAAEAAAQEADQARVHVLCAFDTPTDQD